jgi:transcription initiation factor IIE alpha subunit
MEEHGIRRTEDGGIFCEACGNDLSKDDSSRFAAHLDGTTFYENQFICTACGATLTQRRARAEDDAYWWAE